MRIVFMGSAELSCATFLALARQPDFQIVAVVTQPDKPRGRELKLQPTAVKLAALELGIPVLQPLRARDPGFAAELATFQPDLVAVAAYGQILPKTILDLPRLGCLNVHTSVLPRYRGAGPIQWAILNGDAATGVTIMKMDAGLDTGDIVSVEETAISDADDARTLHDRLAEMGAALLVRTIPGYASGQLKPRPQPADGATHAPKIRKEDGLLDWRHPARCLWNRVRGLVPWPGAFTWMPGGAQPQLLKIWKAQPIDQPGEPGVVLSADKAGILVGCSQGSLRLLEVQREGGRRLSAPDFLTGHRLTPGAVLGSPGGRSGK